MPAKGQKRKQQIIEAAKEMFIKDGFQSTHIGQVCETLDIARGTVYQYFGNKREILYSILEGVEDSVSDIFDEDDLEEYLATKPSPEQMKEFLIKRVSNCIKIILAEPIVIKLIFKEINGIDEEVIQRVSQFLDKIRKTLVRDIEKIRSFGFYKENVNPEITSIILFGGVLLLVHEYDKQGKDLLAKEVLSSIVDVYMKGIL